VKFLHSESSPVVLEAGGYPLTEEMIQRALQLAQILAGADFSPSDAASLRADLIAYFKKEPATQMKAYESFAKLLQKVPPSSFDGKRDNWVMAVLRDNVWQWYGQNPQDFREFQSYPFGKMVLKYNPVLVNSGGMIITKTDVESLFLFKPSRCAGCRSRAAYTGRERSVYTNSSIAVWLHAEMAAGLFEASGRPYAGLRHDLSPIQRYARRHVWRYQEKCSLFCRHFERSPAGGERMRQRQRQILCALST
jgi:hypothetical protein